MVSLREQRARSESSKPKWNCIPTGEEVKTWTRSPEGTRANVKITGIPPGTVWVRICSEYAEYSGYFGHQIGV